MANLTRRSRLFQFILLTMALNGCAAAVDEGGTVAPSEETTGSTSEALKAAAVAEAATLDAAGADCDAAPAKTGARTDAYREYESIVEAADSNLEAAPAGNSCTAACRCCKWGNRFCCSHCRWCSGPIGTTTGVLSQ
jgi:hypothetical protein